ncbi:PSMF1 [Acanthosepion pharaonis]|uniref:Proteasome inhibitor PI31 subunit n=1 Tax=Acanthosepion pharaonis TaxID=158019 RepID=A0A812BZ28_ACAPH|nr:PSMF1 [Sepia pharaonis]
MEGTPGLELLFCSAKAQFKSKHDATICLLHWNFIVNGFKCTGIGEEPGADSGVESELLPEGWNQSSELYTLRYQSSSSKLPSDKNERYLLKAVVTDNTMIVNVMNLQQEKLASKMIKSSDYVTDDWNTTYSKAFKNAVELKKLFKEDLLKEVMPSPSASKQERNPRSPRIPFNDDDPLRIPSRRRERQPRWEPVDPFEIGRADLDPFADGGGGYLPRGAIPPGARYDPIGPGGPRGGPDPDHLPLPNSTDYDDMFM